MEEEDGSQSSNQIKPESIGSEQSRTKRRKTEKQPKQGELPDAKQDRISELPDATLHRILSFLPTKDAVKTGTLSRRWTDLFTSVTNLIFTYEDRPVDKTLNSRKCCNLNLKNFVSFVDKTLILHKCSTNLKQFALLFPFPGQNLPCPTAFQSCIDTWVRFATLANVEELSLKLCINVCCRYILPQHLYTNLSITKLVSSFCEILPNGLISWKSLKSLTPLWTYIGGDTMQKILVGSPVLEYLELNFVTCSSCLNISSESLITLVMKNFGCSLEVSAPNLQVLSMFRMFFKENVRLMNIQSLLECDLEFEPSIVQQSAALQEFLDSIRHVKKLYMGKWFVQFVSSSYMVESKGLPLLSNCECLTLVWCNDQCNLPEISFLLKNTPFLKTLVIHMSNYTPTVKNIHEGSFISSAKYSLLHLKTIKIEALGTGHCDFELVQFLLENASVLEKMIITARMVDDWECDDTECVPKEIFHMALRLCSLPRSSPHAVVSIA